MFGSHLSIAGGLHNALDQAADLGIDCVQIFTQNQRRWVNRDLTPEDLDAWRRSRRKAKLQSVVSHGSYLVNLAGPDPHLRQKSIAALRAEIERCEALDIPLIVLHPGSHMGAGERKGLKRVVSAINRAVGDAKGCKATLCLETTAGQGTGLGCRLENLRDILDDVAVPERLGVCLDTAHMLASGYDLTGAAGAGATLDQCRAIIGADRICVMHLNDSKTPRGSRVDRHEHIGRGHIPLAAFAAIVNDRLIRSIPKILETPKAAAPDGRPWDEVNLEVLRGLLTPGAWND